MRKYLLPVSAVAGFAALAFSLVAVAAPDAPVAPKLTIGAPAPAFTLEDQNGKPVNLADQKGKIVVLEWFNNECPYVQKHYTGQDMQKLASKYTEKGVVWLAINSTKEKDNAANKAIATQWKIDRPILNDAKGTTGHAYGATNTPGMVVLDKNLNVAYIGAIDSDRSSDASKVAGATNYVAKAVDELLAGSTVSQPETKAYGCSVKYAE